jgi:hypothetical protein
MNRESSHDDVWHEDTRPDIKTGRHSDVAPVDTDTLLGQMMASQARIERGQQDILLQLGTLTREQSQLRKDIEKDREELIRGASRKAATHSSNRLAVLMGGLFTLWEVASPYLHELAELLRRHQ